VAEDGVTMNVLAPGTICTDRTYEGAAVEEYRFRGGAGRGGARILAGRLGNTDRWVRSAQAAWSLRAAFVEGVLTIFRYGTSSRLGDWMWTKYRK
jgi:NAD(P)-dependent dehydrogenase (short-subunit alcohol dehydrogenase family)